MKIAYGFWVFNGNHWEHDFYDCHLDNIEPVDATEAEETIELQLQEIRNLYSKATLFSTL